MKPTAMHVATHEAGHALASWWTGRGVSRMTAYFEDEDPDEYSHAQTFPKKPWSLSLEDIEAVWEAEATASTEDDLRKAQFNRVMFELCVSRELLIYFAGPLAEAKCRGIGLKKVLEVGGNDDIVKVTMLLAMLPPDKQTEAQSAAMRRAANLLNRYWYAVEALATEIHPIGALDGEDVEALLQRVTGETPGEYGNDFTSLDH